MKKILLPAIGILASLLGAQAQLFTNGNLAVVRISGYDTTSSTGAAVFIDQYTTGGQLASSFAVPTSGSNALILNGEGYEGLLNLTPDGTELVFAGYNTDLPYASNIIKSQAALVPRVAATLDAYGNFALPVSTETNFNGSAVTSAASDGTNFWMCGTGPTGGLNQICYLGTATAGATNQVVTSLFTSGAREVTLYDVAGTYELFGCGYASSSANGAGGYLLSNILGALPTSATGFTNEFPSGSANEGIDLVINPSGTIAYLADNDIGIVKFTNDGSGWVSNYTILLTNAIDNVPFSPSYSGTATSVTADWSQNPPVVYATSGETITNRLVRFQDTNIYGADLVENLAQGSVVSGSGGVTNTFRGVRFAPGAIPEITSQPESVTNDAGQTVILSVSAVGSPTLTYQWYSNSLAISGATLSTLTLANTDTNYTGSEYYVIVANAFGSDQSSNAEVVINPPGPPIDIVVTPASQTVNAGDTASFTATFVGATNSVSYEWTLNGVPLTDGPFGGGGLGQGGSVISGSTTATLVISNCLATNDGSYDVIISNSFAAVAGGPGVLQVNDPAIITNVMGATNLPGSGPVLLSVTADGTDLSYQWLSDGVVIVGANSSTYTVPNSSVTSAASYSVVVTSADGVSVTNGPTVVDFSPYLLYDAFDYPNGNIFNDHGWYEYTDHNPIEVTNNLLQLSQDAAVADHGNAYAEGVYTMPESNTVFWTSFTLNVQQLPTTRGGTYFAYFPDTNDGGFDFYAKLFVCTSNNPAYTPDLPSATAFPGTYRIGIANEASSPWAMVELDMATNTDYNIVVYFDMVNGYSQVAVNPSQADYLNVYSQSFTPTTTTSALPLDAPTIYPLPIVGYGFRQAPGIGVLDIGDLESSFDWNGAGSGYTAVTASMVPELPVIGFTSPGLTNYAGNTGTIEVAASGIGLSYAWYQILDGVTNALSDTTNFQGSASNALVFSYLAETNAGQYFAVVSDSIGSVTSSIIDISLDTNLTAPIFTLQPLSTTNSLGANVTFTASAVGTGPITYQWYTDGSPDSGATGSSFTLTDVSEDMSGETNYVIATGPGGSTQSSNAIIIVNGPIVTNIAYLRSLIVTSAAPTITLSTAPAASAAFLITGVVTESTNLESATYADYTIQDSTAGIEFFVEDPSFRPALGDVITVAGTLSIFDNNLEIDGTLNDPALPYGYVTNAGGKVTAPLPTPILMPLSLPAEDPGYVAQYLCGSLVTVTNVYFENAGATFANEGSYIVTNAGGTSIAVSLYTGESDGPDILGQTVPSFAYSVTAPLLQYETGSGAFELNVTSISNIVAAPPPAVADLAASVSGTNITLSWTAVPTSYTYSILTATNLTGPWTSQQGGLWFTNSSATYSIGIDTNVPTLFFDVGSP
jgi:hypothetical protein